MTYLDYLLTHTYSELPGEVQAEITTADYATRRAYALRLTEKPVLPQALRQVYQRKLAASERPSRIMPWIAAAGWLVVLTISTLILARDPHLKYVAVPAESVVQRDTVLTTLHDTVTQVIYRTRLRHDTIMAPAAPPALLVLHDTVYVEARTSYPSGTVRVDGASLSLLVGSRAD